MVILGDLIMTLCFLRKTTNLAKCGTMPGEQGQELLGAGQIMPVKVGTVRVRATMSSESPAGGDVRPQL